MISSSPGMYYVCHCDMLISCFDFIAQFVFMFRESWALVMESTSNTFLTMKANDPEFEFGTCLVSGMLWAELSYVSS